VTATCDNATQGQLTAGRVPHIVQFKEWIDDILSLGIWIDTSQHIQDSKTQALNAPSGTLSTTEALFPATTGVEPILPFDIILSTFLVPDIPLRLDTADLLAIRTRQLQKREDDLAAIHTNIL
jgi:hypothetical protein